MTGLLIGFLPDVCASCWTLWLDGCALMLAYDLHWDCAPHPSHPTLTRHARSVPYTMRSIVLPTLLTLLTRSRAQRPLRP